MSNWPALIIWSLCLLVSGYGLSFIGNKALARTIGWSIVVLTIFFCHSSSIHGRGISRMLSLIVPLLIAFKGMTMLETYNGRPGLSFLQWLAFALGWFGMRPALFESLPGTPLPQADYFIRKGLSRMLTGWIFLYIGHYWISHEYLQTLCMLAGMSFMLHFGMLNISTGIWRSCGVNANELFMQPFRSTSLKEFWGKRWNRAFTEMTALIVYQPISGKTRKQTGLFFAFLFSGLLHELALSLPVRNGYGLVLSYFLLQFLAILLEQHSGFVQTMLLHPITCKIWLLSCLLLPLPLLFHSYFVHGVLQPAANWLLS